MNFTKIQKHVHDIFFSLSHSDNTTAADLKADILKHMYICHTLLVSVRRTDLRVKSPAAVQIMIDPVQSGIF